MHTPKIVFLDRATIPSHIQLPALSFEHQWCEYAKTSAEQTLDRIKGAEIVITNKVVLDADILQQSPTIKLIAIAATGTNNVDLEYCVQAGISVCNVRGYATQTVPEHVLAMMFALRRNLNAYHRDIAAGEWQKAGQFCFFNHAIGDIAGSTLGLVGAGSLGQALAEKAKALGMNVVFAERKGRAKCRVGYLEFERVLEQADVLSLHCPLTPETQNLIGAEELNTMKSSAILINTGRGGLVDENALVNALKNGDIAAAGVDVFTCEPADKTNPLLAHIDLPNLLLTPHIAWGSDSAIQKLCGILIGNIEQFAAGETLENSVF